MLVTLLQNYDFEPTVRRISEVTGTTLAQTREDIGQLHRAGICIYPEEVGESLAKDESRYDDEINGLDMDMPTDNPLLFLDKEEREIFSRNKLRSLMIKDTPYAVPDTVRRHAEQIESAIKRRCYVRFRYRSPNEEETLRIEMAPYALFHNTTDDLYYCITFDEKNQVMSYRLDLILFDVHLINARHAADDHRNELERLKYVWGAAFYNHEEPVHVKLRITSGTPNIIQKIKSDTRDRTHGFLVKKEDCYIYEDDIIGLSSFRAWVMSFGSSIKVLEPHTLAEEIRNSSKIRLQNYEDGNRFH